MRILMWFTIGFAAACALSIYLGFGAWICVLTIAAAALAFVIKKPRSKIVAVILIGITVGMLWTAAYNYYYLDYARKYDGKAIYSKVTVTDYGYDTDYGVAADGKVEIAGRKFNVKLYYPAKMQLSPGDSVHGKMRFRMTTDDSLQGGTYHQGNGIFLLVFADEQATVTDASEDSIEFLGAHLRRKISQMIVEIFPADTVGFANALLLGDSSLLDYELDTDFKLSGIRHIIAVSGLHVSILMAVVYVFTARKRFLAPIIGIPVLFLFAAIVGFTPSVVRACIMQALVLLALLLNKDYDPPTALAFAVLTMLCVNPATIVSVSFQLSCGCIVGIFLFYEPINNYILKKLSVPKGKNLKSGFIRWFSGSVSITLSTMVTTTPLSAVYFGTVSIVGIVTNLLTLWVVSFLFCGIGLACIAGLFYLPLAKLMAGLISFPIRFVIWVAKTMAGLPFSAVYTCSIYVVIWLVMCYLLLIVFLLSKKKYPCIFAGCVMFTLILAILLPRLEPVGKNYQVTVFDVGQGQSILIECDNKCYLVDCGGDSDKTAADTVTHALLSRGISRLDGVFVTHYDDDHAGGLPLLLTGISADTLYLPNIEDEGDIRTVLEEGQYNIHWINDSEILKQGTFQFTMVPGEHKTDDNERSLCILFQKQNCDILITGDRSAEGEKALLEKIQLPELELLVVGHHGSKNSSCLEFLSVVRPKAAVISVGRDNSYGHPSQDVLYRLKLFDCSIWRTDLDGTVTFKG